MLVCNQIFSDYKLSYNTSTTTGAALEAELAVNHTEPSEIFDGPVVEKSRRYSGDHWELVVLEVKSRRTATQFAFGRNTRYLNQKVLLWIVNNWKIKSN